jgi:alcohol dehydrogenase
VGLAAIMIARALEARVVAVDINQQALAIAKSIGADYTLDAKAIKDIPGAIYDISGRGVDVSLDALGSETTSINSVLCLKKRGKHIQIGLLAGDDYRPQLPLEKVIANELEILGSHGMQAWKYAEMLDLIINKKLDPQKLVSNTVSLDAVPDQFIRMTSFMSSGLTIIDRF